jgi:hypothetical protein
VKGFADWVEILLEEIDGVLIEVDDVKLASSLIRLV